MINWQNLVLVICCFGLAYGLLTQNGYVIVPALLYCTFYAIRPIIFEEYTKQ